MTEELPKLERPEMEALIQDRRGDVVGVLLKTASDDDVLQFFQSLQRSAILLGEPVPGAQEEEEEDAHAVAGGAPPAAAPGADASAAPPPVAAPPQPAPAAAPEPPPRPAHAMAPDTIDPATLQDLRIETINLLKALAAHVKVANARQITSLRAALKVAQTMTKAMKDE